MQIENLIEPLTWVLIGLLVLYIIETLIKKK